MKKTPLSIRLSTEELMLVLWLLNTPTLPGIGGNPFGGWSPEQISAALDSAERSLRARRLVSKGEGGQLQMEQVVMALVGTCAVPEFSIVLTSEAPDTGRIVHYFHATHLLTVEHSNPEPGVHLFEALPETSMIQERLEALAQIDQQPAPQANPTRLAVGILQETTQAAEKDPQKAAALLTNAGASKETAQELSNALAHVRRRSVFASVQRLRDAHPSSSGFVLLEGPTGFWGMQIEGEDASAIVHIWTQSAKDVRQRLKELIAGETLTFS
jgi:hypothetical protein